ncbi:hypothetical protein NUBL17188_51810 [Klebsiella pneumoniae]|nr:hypothetical protein NUBL17188_51810 [Klebsiella pneumoniae]
MQTNCYVNPKCISHHILIDIKPFQNKRIKYNHQCEANGDYKTINYCEFIEDFFKLYNFSFCPQFCKFSPYTFR